MVSDPVGDFIIRLTNAGAIKKPTVSVPFSNLKLAIAEKLMQAGFIGVVEKKGKKVKKTLDIVLKYDAAGKAVINGVRRISKPGRRMYRSVLEITPVKYGKGAMILSTPQGIMTDKEAKKAKVGGEAMFEIW
jgi:small subunit ribosomal protein S8